MPLLFALLLAHAATPTPASAQGAARRICYLAPAGADSQTANLAHLRQGLAAVGAQEGRDYVIEARFANQRVDRLGPMATELAALGCHVAIAQGPAIAHALRARPPMRVVGLGDLAEVAGLAGSGPADTRLTGVDLVFDALNLKRLATLAELIKPRTSVVVMAAPAARDSDNLRAVLALARGQLGLTVHEHYGLAEADIEQAFAIAQRERAAGLYFHNHPVFNGRRAQAIALAAKTRLPVMYQWPGAVRDGGLIAYGPDSEEVYHQLARQAWRVATGTPPAALPQEQPTRILLVINQKTAKALGLRIPQALLARADEVIE